MKEQQEENLQSFKTIVIGNSMAGKSTLLVRFLDDVFIQQTATVAIDYRYKNVNYNGLDFKIELWDSAGQQRYRTMAKNYFHLSKASCVVFDLTDQRSLEGAKDWLEDLTQLCGNQIPKLLLGNKCDLLSEDERRETLNSYKETINELKSKFNCQFFIVSGKTGQNVNEAFNYLIKELYTKYAKANIKPISSGIKLEQIKEPQVKTKKKCC